MKMAALYRISSRLFSRPVLFNAVRSSSGGSMKNVKEKDVYEAIDTQPRTSIQAFEQEIKGDKPKEPAREKVMEALGYTVGEQRYEMLEKLRGVSDPFDIAVQRGDGRGTLKDPILVPSACGERLVGCVCEEDCCDINWMTIYNGEKKKCECGHFFQLVPIQGAGDGHH